MRVCEGWGGRGGGRARIDGEAKNSKTVPSVLCVCVCLHVYAYLYVYVYIYIYMRVGCMCVLRDVLMHDL
jgi:hypothetical protein